MNTIFDIKARDIMSKEIKKIDINERASKALGIILNERIHNLVVFDKNKYKGFFGYKQLVRLYRTAPRTTKVGYFLFRSTKISKNTSLIDIADLMYKWNYKILPVLEKDKIVGVVSERDILKISMNLEELKNKKIKEIMTSSPFYIKKKDKLSKAINLLRDKNISRLPVLDDNNKVIGLLEAFDVLREIVPKEGISGRQDYGQIIDEKVAVSKALVSSVMNSKIVKANDDDLLLNRLGELSKLDQSTIIVVDGKDNLRGIIAPKDIIEYLASLKKKEGVYVQVSGSNDLEISDFEKTEISKLIEDTVQKLGEIEKINFLTLHIKSYHETGKKIKYSLRSRVSTDSGLFTTKSWGWDIIDVCSNLLKDLERIVIKKLRKKKDVMIGKLRRSKEIKKGF